MDSSIRSRAARKALQWRARYGSMSEPAGPPPAVERDLDEPFADFWRRRIDQHNDDSYAGLPLAKFPEDLRVYQHLIWESRADTVIEVGTKWGGSMLWFRDQLRAFAGYGRLGREPTVIGVDLLTSHARTLLERADPSWPEQIKLVEGDLREEETMTEIEREVDPLARCLVIEDAAHTGEVTTAALEGLAHFVPEGGFFVVEDGHVDIERLHPQGPPTIKQLGVRAGGVQPAVAAWLETAEGSEFTLREDLELYGTTSHPGGYLQRRPTP
ncbi:MAG: CmcI family methyltransferase [Solirubrobacterales bacterium]